MKKSIVITILLVYVASIVIVGFFGIAVKVYDEVKYVQSITMSVESTNSESYTWEDISQPNSIHKYYLEIDFSKAEEGMVEDKNGNLIDTKYLGFTFIPQITYMSGDVEAENKIIYSMDSDDKKKQEKGYFTLNEYGVFTVFYAPFTIIVYVNPQDVNRASINAPAQIIIYCG